MPYASTICAHVWPSARNFSNEGPHTSVIRVLFKSAWRHHSRTVRRDAQMVRGLGTEHYFGKLLTFERYFQSGICVACHRVRGVKRPHIMYDCPKGERGLGERSSRIDPPAAATCTPLETTRMRHQVACTPLQTARFGLPVRCDQLTSNTHSGLAGYRQWHPAFTIRPIRPNTFIFSLYTQLESPLAQEHKRCAKASTMSKLHYPSGW